MRAGEPGQSVSAPDGLGMTLVMTPGASGGTRLEMEWRVPPGKRLVISSDIGPTTPGNYTTDVGTILDSINFQ